MFFFTFSISGLNTYLPVLADTENLLFTRTCPTLKRRNLRYICLLVNAAAAAAAAAADELKRKKKAKSGEQ